MPICEGCHRDFSLSGYRSHLRHTHNPPCAAIYQEAFQDIPLSDDIEVDEVAGEAWVDDNDGIAEAGEYDPPMNQDDIEDEDMPIGVIPGRAEAASGTLLQIVPPCDLLRRFTR